MKDFSRIAKPNLLYKGMYGYVRFALRYIYYRRFQVIGRNNIPKDKKEGFLLICNHQNGLVDALSIIFAVAPREPVFLARGDIFKKDSIAKLLMMLRILPAYRKRDVGTEGLDQNEAIFEQTAQLMQEGVVVAIFPEAGHQNHHFLGTFKKGFARMAFGYEEACNFSKDLKILPLGHHYLGYDGMQADALFTIGEPFTFEELYDIYREHPERGRYLLSAKARERVESMVLNIEEPERYEAVEQLCRMYVPVYEKKHKLRPDRLKNDLTARKAVNAALKADDYKSELIDKAAQYVENLKKLKMDDHVVERTGTWGFIARTLLWIVLLPLFLLSAVINFVPHHVARMIARKVKDKMLVTSMQFGVGILAFPVWYLIMFAAIWIIFGKFWIALVALLLMPLSMIVYHNLGILTSRLVSRMRKYRLKLRRDPLMKQTQRLRRDIMSGLNKLMK